MTKNRYKEFVDLLDSIEQNYSIFYTIGRMGVPVFTNELPTAAIKFNPKNGQEIQFIFNPTFWDQLNTTERRFCIYHEMLHVILSHGVRTKDTKSHVAVNLCLDIVVNEMLFDEYGFDINDMPTLSKIQLCTRSTIFPDDKTIQPARSFEYYFGKLKSKIDEMIKNGFSMKPMDSHDHLSGFLESACGEEIVKRLTNELSDKELEQFVKKVKEKNGSADKSCSSLAGTVAGGVEQTLSVFRIPKKRKWETIIKKWSKKYINDNITEHWARENYRMSLVIQNLTLPGRLNYDAEEKKKIGVYFYLDTSGSCAHLGERFFKAAKTLPDDTFDMRLFCFDTQVYKVSLKEQKLYGFGGTAFNIIEDHILENIRNEQAEYPKAVFVITDAEGNQVRPRHPKRWHWFLTESLNSRTKEYLPPESNIHMLKDFE